MQETKRMAEQANRMGEEIQERTQRMGREYQKAVESGFEAASQSFREVNRGFQAMAAELTDFSKRTWEDGIQAWEQLRHSETWSKFRRGTPSGRMTPTCPRYQKSERFILAQPAMPLSQAKSLQKASGSRDFR